jgi:hypothetical protein
VKSERTLCGNDRNNFIKGAAYVAPFIWERAVHKGVMVHPYKPYSFFKPFKG